MASERSIGLLDSRFADLNIPRTGFPVASERSAGLSYTPFSDVNIACTGFSAFSKQAEMRASTPPPTPSKKLPELRFRYI